MAEEIKSNTRGGARVGAGQKPKTVQDASGAAFILYSRARAKKETHNAKLAEIEEMQKLGSLVDSNEVKKRAGTAGRAVRDAFLSLPDRVSSLLVGRTEKEINEELFNEVRLTLEGLSNEISE